MATYIPQGADGATAPSLTVPVGGKDGSGNLQTLTTDVDGNLQVDVLTLPAAPANGGVDIGDVTINNAGGASAVNVQDGGNSLTVDVTGVVSVVNPPAASGGLTTYHLVSAGSTNATSIKGTAGQVYGWYIYNSNAAARKVAFHNTSGTPTAGSSVFFSLVIPPGGGANVFTDKGIAFSSGIGITTVTELGDAGSSAVASEDLIINIWYN